MALVAAENGDQCGQPSSQFHLLAPLQNLFQIDIQSSNFLALSKSISVQGAASLGQQVMYGFLVALADNSRPVSICN